MKEFSQNLKQSVREFDFVARVGGDEFAVILNNLHDHSAVKNIIEKYDPYSNRFMAALLEGGITALIELANSNGVEVDINKYWFINSAS